MDFYDLLGESPIIAAVKDEQDIKECLQTKCKIVFVLFGTVNDIADIVEIIKRNGKIVIVHLDLIAGFSSKDVIVDFIKTKTCADGVISTKSNLVKKAQEMGMIAIQRTFLVDSMALASLLKQISLSSPTAIEILPGIIPQIISQIRGGTNIPIIASGLLTEKKEVISALSAGADAISTTNKKLWCV